MDRKPGVFKLPKIDKISFIFTFVSSVGIWRKVTPQSLGGAPAPGNVTGSSKPQILPNPQSLLQDPAPSKCYPTPT